MNAVGRWTSTSGNAAALAEAEVKLPELTREGRDLASRIKEIEDAVYDLKAVNPHRKPDVDTRTPKELIALIQATGREIAEALAALHQIRIHLHRAVGGGLQFEDLPKHEVMALPERKAFEIRFPIVEGYVVSLKRNLVKCDVSRVERTQLDPWTTPTVALVRPQVRYQIGHASAHVGFEFELVDRQSYFDSVHPQTIQFEIAREIVRALTEAAHPGKDHLLSQGRRGHSASAGMPDYGVRCSSRAQFQVRNSRRTGMRPTQAISG